MQRCRKPQRSGEGQGDADEAAEGGEAITLSIVHQDVTCAATASRLFHQNTTLHQIINVPQGGILRAFGQFGPFGRSQLAFKTVEQPVDDGSLAFIEWLVGMSLPEMGLMEDAGQDMFRAVKDQRRYLLNH